MKNLPDIRIAIVVGSTDWLPSEVAIENRRRFVESYKSVYGGESLYECSVCITDNELNNKRVMREINKAECNAVCLIFANYGPESAGTLFAQEFDGPVMMLAFAEEGDEPYTIERKDSLSGFINACYAIRLRKSDVYIPSHPIGTIEKCVANLHDFISIARTIIAIKGLKLVSIGPRPSSYLASSAPNYLLYDLGIEVSEFSEMELYDSYNKHEDDNRIKGIISEMSQEVGGEYSSEMLSKYAQYELTIKDWIRNHKGSSKYITLTSTCWPAFPISFGFVPCYVNSRLTSEGYPVACEVDGYGAVSEYIGQSVSGETVTILNINNNVPEEFYNKEIKNKEFGGKHYDITDLFLGYHCGVTPSCRMTSSRLDYHFVNKNLIGEDYSKGTIQGVIQSGPVTIFRLQGMRDNRLRAYVAQGQILPVKMETYGGQGIIAVPELERFIRYVILEKQFPNHCAVLFGHYAENLINVLSFLGVEEIYYNHPSNIPYKNETVYANSEEWF